MTNLIDYAKIPTENFILEQMQENTFLSINALNNAIQGFNVEELNFILEELQKLQEEIETDIAEIRTLAAMVTSLSSQIAANTVLANNAQIKADSAFTLASTHSTDIANNTAAIATAVSKAEDAETTAEAAEATANSAKQTAESVETTVAANTLKINTNTQGLATATTKLATIEEGAEVNPDAAEIKQLYESNGNTNAFTDTDSTVVGRFPTDSPPLNNVPVGDGNGNYLNRNISTVGLPQITFHYLTYDDQTGQVSERYAEDTETFTIDPAVEYQPGFEQNEFTLIDGVLIYTG